MWYIWKLYSPLFSFAVKNGFPCQLPWTLSGKRSVNHFLMQWYQTWLQIGQSGQHLKAPELLKENSADETQALVCFFFFFLMFPEWFQYTAKFDSYSIWEGLVPGPCYKITWCSWLSVFIGWIHGCETHRHRADYTKDFLNTYGLHETLSILATPFAGETSGG